MEVLQYEDRGAVHEQAGNEALYCCETGLLERLRPQARDSGASPTRPEPHDMGEESQLFVIGLPGKGGPHGPFER
jgi:hypothetical protein